VGAHVEQVIIILDTTEAIMICDQILMDENLVRAFEGRRDDETTTLVVERRKDDGGGGRVFDAV